jgi:tetratricopeptide (TPR) repeat protein
MKSRIHLQVLSFAGLLIVNGCSSVGQEVQAGRNALQTGHPNEAVSYLARAAAQDPNYTIPYRLHESVLTYLGRAYYETGRDADAREILEKAVARNPEDSTAHLYLGLTLIRSGDRDRGAKELESGLKGTYDRFEYIASDTVSGIFWDPTRRIRNKIQATLSQKPESAEVVLAAQRIGTLVDQEIDVARRNESQTRFSPNVDN